MEAFVSVDEQGRTVIPKKVREKIGAKKFAVEVVKNKIVLIPVKSIDEIFGSAPQIDMKAFRREHEKER